VGLEATTRKWFDLSGGYYATGKMQGFSQTIFLPMTKPVKGILFLPAISTKELSWQAIL
jgi:hypothetical protein